MVIIVTTNCNINLPKMNTAGTKLFWLSFLSAVSSISKGLVHCGMTVSSGWDVGRTLSLSMIGSTHSYSCSSNGMTSPAVVSCTSGPNTRTGDSGCRPRLTVAFKARALGSLCDDVGLCRWHQGNLLYNTIMEVHSASICIPVEVCQLHPEKIFELRWVQPRHQWTIWNSHPKLFCKIKASLLGPIPWKEALPAKKNK